MPLIPKKPVTGPPGTSEKSFRRLFELFGVTFSMNGSTEAHADACPFCGKAKFYLDTNTGQYKCHSANSCGESGNAFTFIRRVYEECLRPTQTTDEKYQLLKQKRGLPLQTLKRHKLAWCAALGCWLVPFMSERGEPLNLQRYFVESGDKMNLPCLPMCLYGLDTLSSDTGRLLFIVEGAFDAIALDHHLRYSKTRDRYDILAAPSANVFKPEWLRYLNDRAVRVCFDNDKAGHDGQERIAKLCRENKSNCKLHTLTWPSSFEDKYDIGDLVRDGKSVVEFTRDHCVKVNASERRIHLVRGDTVPREQTSWLWERHIPLGGFCSLSGPQGSLKSTIAKDLAARATSGLPMPNCSKGLAPFNVLFFTSEDSGSQLVDLVKIHGGDVGRIFVHDIASGNEPINILDLMDDMEAEINARQVRLVILDALNSFVGGDISNDANARRTLSGRLQALARRTGACIIGIRNFGRMDGIKASQKSLGAISLSHVARCDMNTEEIKVKDGEQRRFKLEFEKVSGTAQPRAIPYTVDDLSTSAADSHMRRIVWGNPMDLIDPAGVADAVREYLAKKRSEKR